MLATINVSTTSDVVNGGDGVISLREAITTSNGNGENDTINLSAGTYVISITTAGSGEANNATGDFDVKESGYTVTIQGAGAGSTIIDANEIERLFEVFTGATLIIEDVTLTDGKSKSGQTGGAIKSVGTLTLRDCILDDHIASSSNGGAIAATAGSVTLENCTISNSSATYHGGAIYVDSVTLTISGSTLSTNSVATYRGGGIYAIDSTVSVSTSTITGNSADDGGGGAFFSGGGITIASSTISNNTSDDNGGGLMFSMISSASISDSTVSGNTGINGGGVHYNVAGSTTLAITNSTFSGNTATSKGGGIYTAEKVSLTNVTVYGNHANTSGGGLASANDGDNNEEYIALNTLIAGNTAGTSKPDVDGKITSQDYNLIQDTTGATITGTTTHNIYSQNPLLGSLQNQGGPTSTHALASNSPAIDAGTNSGAPGTDQRGISRPNDGDNNATATVDIGAYEFRYNHAPVNSVPDSQTTDEDTTLTFSTGNSNLISISDSDASSVPIQVTLTATNGTVTLYQTTSLSFSTGDGTADATMTFTGTVTNLNAALSGLQFIPTANYNGSGSLQIVTNDLAANADATAQSDTDTINITISAVNDVPVNSVPGTQNTDDNESLVFSTGNSNLISISDVDAAGSSVEVTLTATNGAVTLSGTSGLTFSDGYGTLDTTMTFTGTISNINTALAGLQFTPTPFYSGTTASLQIVTDDQGNTGSGGAQSDSDTVNITLNSINDPPFNFAPEYQIAQWNTPLVFSADTGNEIVILDDAGSSLIEVSLTSTNGTMTLSGTTGLTFSTGDGTTDAAMTFTGTLANINAALDGLQFIPTTDYSGDEAEIEIETSDQGNTGTGGTLTDTDTVSITVEEAPTISITTLRSTGEADAGVVKAWLLVSRGDAFRGDLTVYYTVSGTATADVDYEELSGSVVIPDYETNVSILFDALDDGSYEGNETVIVTLSSDSHYEIDSEADEATVEIAEDEQAPSTTGITNVEVDEEDPNEVIDLWDAFSDGESDDDDLTFVAVSHAAPFVVATVNNTTGELTLEFAADYSGVSQVDVTCYDEDGNHTTTSFTVTVNPDNDAPTSVPYYASVPQDADDFAIPLNHVFTDLDDFLEDLEFVIDSNSNEGLVTATIDDFNVLQISLAAGAHGTATIEITATDSEELTATEEITIEVYASAAGEVTGDIVYSFHRGALSIYGTDEADEIVVETDAGEIVINEEATGILAEDVVLLQLSALDGADEIDLSGLTDLVGIGQAISVFGGDGADTLIGSDYKDILFGEAGNDSLSGGAEADWLIGGEDSDLLYGEAGDDRLDAGALAGADSAADSLYGGADNDVMVVSEVGDYWQDSSGTNTLEDGDVFPAPYYTPTASSGTGYGAGSGSGSGSGSGGTAPIANDDTVDAIYRTAKYFPASSILTNDTDPDGNRLTPELYSDPEGFIVFDAYGNWTFTPDLEYDEETYEFEYIVSDGLLDSAPATVTINIAKPTVDLDVDSDNSGTMSRNLTEENIETVSPGKMLRYNNDDDTFDGTEDRLDQAPLPAFNQFNTPNIDDDLGWAEIEVSSNGADLTDFKLTIVSSNSKVQRWADNLKHPFLASYVIGTNTIPFEVYLEGISFGLDNLDLILYNPAGIEVARDSVALTVAKLNAIPYRHRTTPFRSIPIDDGSEDAPGLGIGIRPNQDNDDKNALVDAVDTHIPWENDLVQVDLRARQAPVPGMHYKLMRSNSNIRVYLTADKSLSLLTAGTSVPITLQSDTETVWVEWPDVAAGTSMLSFQMITDNTNYVVWQDDITFKPFESVVIVFGGRTAVPADPVTHLNQQGTFDTAIGLYREGYDVHMYWEGDIDKAYDEVVNAVEKRGVTNVAIMGYSWGGGRTYELADRLSKTVGAGGNVTDITNAFDVEVTAYTDAIKPGTPNAETRLPPLTMMHINQYQMNEVWRGVSIAGATNYDRTSRTYVLNGVTTPLDHLFIDDDALVIETIRQAIQGMWR